ncbi:MAG: FIST N-terminal domain-containing protein [Microthrixaceae bacterium]
MLNVLAEETLVASEAGVETSGGERRPSTRWFGVGRSIDPDSRLAGAEAASHANRGPTPGLVVVFASAGHDLKEVAAGVAEAAPGVEMVGVATSGEVLAGDEARRGVAVAALGGPGFSVATSVTSAASSDLFRAGARAAEVCAGAPERPHRVLMMLSDSRSGDQQELVRGAYAEVGASIPIVGGATAEDPGHAPTGQLHNGEAHSDAVVSVIIGSDAPIGIGVRHGWTSVGEPMLISRSEGTELLEIDGAPALERYLRALGAPPSLAEDSDAFVELAMLHPLGIRRRRSEEVRFVGGCDPARGSLRLVAGIPDGTPAWLMEGDGASVMAGTIASCREAVDALGPFDPQGLLMFDCIARRSVLGVDGLDSKLVALAPTLGDTPVAGFYTAGEFARLRGVRGFHNQTLVSLAFA